MADRIAKQTGVLLMAALICLGLAHLIVRFSDRPELPVVLVSAGAMLLLMLERVLPAWPPLLAWAWGGALAGIFIGTVRQLPPGPLRKLVILFSLLGAVWWIGEANGRIALAAQIKGMLRQSGMSSGGAGQSTSRGMITGDHVTLRAAPSTSAQKLGSLRQGQQVNLLGRSGDWYQIQSGTLRGYVHRTLLAPLGSPREAAADEEDTGSDTAPLTQAQIVVRSHPPASVMINGEYRGWTEVRHAATPGEKLHIRFEAEGYDVLQIEQTAPPAGGMTIVEQTLRPVHFPYGRWRVQWAGAEGELILARGRLNYIAATLLLPEHETMECQGRFDPVDRILRMNDVNNVTSGGRWQARLNEELNAMNGELFLDPEAPGEPFAAMWVSSD
ncbi:MAG: SH3 domain-containing protein [candidate division KSB1 bacterium]|nr:SH3 domain-containing protein [candidate division KSB1 bacterium]MDZ7300452.1 SH3 domain-containing protein [candidate division KSB1 bacterium]MDZ7308630.1 SH3 domain-containing protein [candidate division KSB1 bacterium]MDZ7351446.1 SH3 domain-containing protein [candidate division KSB1 bacterium]MDZ7355805.1 SH3 domain-containing protein [candidate division KSB1 bacterium]